MPIIPYTGPALALGNPGGYWASEAGAAVQPNIKLAPRLAHFEKPPPPEDEYVEIYEVPTPPNSQYNEIVIHLHDDIEEFNLDIQKILDQIPESIKGKSLSVKLSLEGPVSPTRADPEPESTTEPESKPTSTAAPAEQDPAAAPPKTRLTFALPQNLKPHPAEQNWVYLGKKPPPSAPPSNIEAINSELQRTAMQIGIINAEAEAAWQQAEEERKAAEAAGNEAPRTAQSGPPLPKPSCCWTLTILPPDFWETHSKITPNAVVKNEKEKQNQEASVPVEEEPYGPEDEVVYDSRRSRHLVGPNYEEEVELRAIVARTVGPLPEDWLEKFVLKRNQASVEGGYDKTAQLYKVIEGDLWKKVTVR